MSSPQGERPLMLIVGAGPGMGRAVALLAAQRGMDVALVARTETTLRETAAQVEALGAAALCLPADATDADAMERVVADVLARFGRVDVLVHSLLPPHLFHRIVSMGKDELERWRRSVEISTYGALLAAYYVAKPMVAAKRGSMVFVTATSGLQSYPAISSHAVGKAGIHALMQSVASELGETGIRANAVAIGVIAGETSQTMPVFDDPQVNADLKRAVDSEGGALGRNITEREAAETVMFLASDASSGMTGQILAVDGGKFFH